MWFSGLENVELGGNASQLSNVLWPFQHVMTFGERTLSPNFQSHRTLGTFGSRNKEAHSRAAVYMIGPPSIILVAV